MTQRIIQEDLDINLATYVAMLKRLGMPHENITLINGSKKFGNSFKLVYVDPETGGHSDAPGTHQGFMGWTKREAFDSFRYINRTLGDVLRHLEG